MIINIIKVKYYIKNQRILFPKTSLEKLFAI